MEYENSWIHDVALTSIKSHYNSKDIPSNYSILCLEKRIWSQQHMKKYLHVIKSHNWVSMDYAYNA